MKHFMVQKYENFAAFPVNYFNSYNIYFLIILRFGLLVGQNKHCENVSLGFC